MCLMQAHQVENIFRFRLARLALIAQVLIGSINFSYLCATKHAGLSMSTSGQKGIISSLAVCPDWTGTFAAGSFARSVGIYSLQTNKRVLMLRGIDFGVTHMKYAPQSSHILWVGGRKSSHISCYDLRMPKVELGR